MSPPFKVDWHPLEGRTDRMDWHTSVDKKGFPAATIIAIPDYAILCITTAAVEKDKWVCWDGEAFIRLSHGDAHPVDKSLVFTSKKSKNGGYGSQGRWIAQQTIEAGSGQCPMESLEASLSRGRSTESPHKRDYGGSDGSPRGSDTRNRSRSPPRMPRADRDMYPISPTATLSTLNGAQSVVPSPIAMMPRSTGAKKSKEDQLFEYFHMTATEFVQVIGHNHNLQKLKVEEAETMEKMENKRKGVHDACPCEHCVDSLRLSEGEAQRLKTIHNNIRTITAKRHTCLTGATKALTSAFEELCEGAEANRSQLADQISVLQRELNKRLDDEVVKTDVLESELRAKEQEDVQIHQSISKRLDDLTTQSTAHIDRQTMHVEEHDQLKNRVAALEGWYATLGKTCDELGPSVNGLHDLSDAHEKKVHELEASLEDMRKLMVVGNKAAWSRDETLKKLEDQVPSIAIALDEMKKEQKALKESIDSLPKASSLAGIQAQATLVIASGHIQQAVARAMSRQKEELSAKLKNEYDALREELDPLMDLVHALQKMKEEGQWS